MRSRGELAQMVERPLRMWEVTRSIPGFSNFIIYQLRFLQFFLFHCNTLNVQWNSQLHYLAPYWQS